MFTSSAVYLTWIGAAGNVRPAART